MDQIQDMQLQTTHGDDYTTNLSGIQDTVKAAINGMANLGHAAGLFDKMKITGGAEKWIHGEGHHVGLKIDLDPSIPIGWLENMANLFGFGIGEEDAGNRNHHYDLSFDRRYGVGGNKLYTPHKYLTEMSMAEMYPSSSSGGAKNLSYASI